MDSVKVLKETVSSGPTAQVQTQASHSHRPKELHSNASAEGKLKSKATDKNCNHKMPISGGGECMTAPDRVADDFREKLNLHSEHCVNGLINGVEEEGDLKGHSSSLPDHKFLSECSSHCKCISVVRTEYQDQNVLHNPTSDVSCTLLHGKDCKSPEIGHEEENDIVYVSYESELQMPDIMRLIQKDLSEPYSIYTYRYFIHNWPKLCFLAMTGSECVGAIVCKLDLHRKAAKRGYIAMLAVDENHRKKGIGSNLVLKAIGAMVDDDADEVVLETEITNQPALRLYENLGFVRDKRLFRYYLNGVDALRLKLWLR